MSGKVLLDPVISLAFVMYSNPGAYALLVGSGVSRSAGVLTGWEIIIDLIRKVNTLEGGDLPDNDEAAIAWYDSRFGKKPGYSELIETIAKTNAARTKLLHAYFEPSEDEREQGLKVPSLAHKAIAQMVADGYVRVVLTTNFDRLLENAIQEAGITPVLISSPNALDGALPLAQNKCTVIKLHGDYLDSRTLNTREELGSYDSKISGLLQRILDEYGLIIIGWSGEWDTALRDALERRQSRRYTLYWAARSQLKPASYDLLTLQNGEVISIDNADSFLSQLNGKLVALKDSYSQNPLSVKTAQSMAKRYLSDERYQINFFDLVVDTTDHLMSILPEVRSETSNEKRAKAYEGATEILRTIVAEGCYWRGSKFRSSWHSMLLRVTRFAGLVQVTPALDLYPSLLLSYSGGLAALACGDYETLATFMIGPSLDFLSSGQEERCILYVFPANVLAEVAKTLIKNPKHRTAESFHLFQVLREPMQRYVPDDIEYEHLFDRFEYLRSLAYICTRSDSTLVPNAPLGCFTWRDPWDGEMYRVARDVQQEISAEGNDWSLVKAGIFSNYDHAYRCKETLDQMLAQQTSLRF